MFLSMFCFDNLCETKDVLGETDLNNTGKNLTKTLKH